MKYTGLKLYCVTCIAVLITVCSVGQMMGATSSKIKETDSTTFLMKDGRSNYVIVIPDEEVQLVFPKGERVDYAGIFLQSYLKQVTGVQLEVVKESTVKSTACRIFVGPTKSAKMMHQEP